MRRAKAVRIPKVLDADRHSFFFALLKLHKIPTPTTELAFAAPLRKWRFDYCWIPERVGLEVDGSIWTAGRHTRGSGWLKDSEKLNTAATMGFRMLRCTPQQLHSLDLLDVIRKTLNYGRP